MKINLIFIASVAAMLCANNAIASIVNVTIDNNALSGIHVTAFQNAKNLGTCVTDNQGNCQLDLPAQIYTPILLAALIKPYQDQFEYSIIRPRYSSLETFINPRTTADVYGITGAYLSPKFISGRLSAAYTNLSYYKYLSNLANLPWGSFQIKQNPFSEPYNFASLYVLPNYSTHGVYVANTSLSTNRYYYIKPNSWGQSDALGYDYVVTDRMGQEKIQNLLNQVPAYSMILFAGGNYALNHGFSSQQTYVNSGNPILTGLNINKPLILAGAQSPDAGTNLELGVDSDKNLQLINKQPVFSSVRAITFEPAASGTIFSNFNVNGNKAAQALQDWNGSYGTVDALVYSDGARGVTIQHDYITNSLADGIGLYQSPYSKVLASVITSNGLGVYGSANYIGAEGITATSSDGVIENDNYIAGNSQLGSYVYNSDNVSITNSDYQAEGSFDIGYVEQKENLALNENEWNNILNPSVSAAVNYSNNYFSNNKQLITVRSHPE